MLDLGPLRRGNDAGEKVVRKDLLGAFLAAIDREGYTLIQKAEVGGLLSSLQLIGGEGGEVFQEKLVMAVELTWRSEHLIVGMVQQIVVHCDLRELRGRVLGHVGSLSIAVYHTITNRAFLL